MIRTNFLEQVHRKEDLLKRRLSQREIARELNISPHAVGRWMRGEVEQINLNQLLSFIEYFECELEDLIIIDELPEASN